MFEENGMNSSKNPLGRHTTRLCDASGEAAKVRGFESTPALAFSFFQKSLFGKKLHVCG